MELQCPRCAGQVPAVAHFCHSCGTDLKGSDDSRRKSYAAQPDQAVLSFQPVDTIMPRGAAGHPGTYRIATLVTLLLMIITAAFGALPLALVVAAFAVPIVYIVYIYDVNQWEDEPVMVTALAFLLTFALAFGFTWLWRGWVQNPGISGAMESYFDWSGLLVCALLVPIVGELIRQIGPLVLASRPAFDDLMDGFTFGVIAGVAYAAAETLVLYWKFFALGFTGSADPLTLILVLLQHGFIKPLIYGTATGIAGAEFSGLGKGYDGFSGRWAKAVVVAILAVASYQVGLYTFASLVNNELGVLLGFLWALVILAALTFAARNVLHIGLLEAALEASARRDPSVGAEGDLEFCPKCEMPLLAGSIFCTNCGVSVDALSGHHHREAKPAQPATVGGRTESTDPDVTQTAEETER